MADNEFYQKTGQWKEPYETDYSKLLSWYNSTDSPAAGGVVKKYVYNPVAAGMSKFSGFLGNMGSAMVSPNTTETAAQRTNRQVGATANRMTTDIAPAIQAGVLIPQHIAENPYNPLSYIEAVGALSGGAHPTEKGKAELSKVPNVTPAPPLAPPPPKPEEKKEPPKAGPAGPEAPVKLSMTGLPAINMPQAPPDRSISFDNAVGALPMPTSMGEAIVGQNLIGNLYKDKQGEDQRGIDLYKMLTTAMPQFEHMRNESFLTPFKAKESEAQTKAHAATEKTNAQHERLYGAQANAYEHALSPDEKKRALGLGALGHTPTGIKHEKLDFSQLAGLQKPQLKVMSEYYANTLKDPETAMAIARYAESIKE